MHCTNVGEIMDIKYDCLTKLFSSMWIEGGIYKVSQYLVMYIAIELSNHIEYNTMDDRRYHYLSLEYEVFDVVDFMFSYTLIHSYAFTFEC